MSGLPQLDPANPTAVLLGIEGDVFGVQQAIAKVTDPLVVDVGFHVGGTLAQNFKDFVSAAGTPLAYSIEIFYESIGDLAAPAAAPPFQDEGTWGTITGDNSEGVDVSVAPATGVLFLYSKPGASLPAIPNMTPGPYKLTMAVTFPNVPLFDDIYAVLEGPIIRRT